MSHKKYRGKTKTELVEEAFDKMGLGATQREVNFYLREYGVKKDIYSSMYYKIRRDARRNAKPVAHAKTVESATPPVQQKAVATGCDTSVFDTSILNSIAEAVQRLGKNNFDKAVQQLNSVVCESGLTVIEVTQLLRVLSVP